MAQKQQVRPRPLWQNLFHRRNQWTVKLGFWRRFIQVISGHCGKVLWDSGAGLRWISRFYSPQRKIFHGVTVRRRAGRPEVAPGGPTRGGSGGIFRAPDKGIFLGRLDVGNRGTRSGIPVSSKSEQEVVLLELTRNQQQQERQTAAGSGGQRRTVAGSAD